MECYVVWKPGLKCCFLIDWIFILLVPVTVLVLIRLIYRLFLSGFVINRSGYSVYKAKCFLITSWFKEKTPTNNNKQILI